MSDTTQFDLREYSFDEDGEIVHTERTLAPTPASVSVEADDHEQIIDLIESMEEKGTFRSRVGGSIAQQKARWLVGLGAQLALAQFIETHHESIESVTIDTRAYDSMQADDGDLFEYTTTDGETHTCGSCEVKKTASYANHVAITRSEAQAIDSDEPVAYVTTNWEGDINWDAPRDSLDRLSTIDYEIKGYCHLDDLSWTEQGEEKWTQNSDNLCQPFSEMRTDWAEFIDHVFPDL